MPKKGRLYEALVGKTLGTLGLELVSRRGLAYLREEPLRERSLHVLLSSLPSGREVYPLLAESKSQLLQDLVVLAHMGLARRGYFVEIGAADGLHLSNSYLLEKRFGWNGIVCEPVRRWHTALMENRHCEVDTRAAWSSSGIQIGIREDKDLYFSTAINPEPKRPGNWVRKERFDYFVESVSLVDLLGEHQAPRVIDYLSIDTEGSEFEILSGFNFDLYRFRFITVEHNFGDKRESTVSLLSENGYRRLETSFSRWEDWFVDDSK